MVVETYIHDLGDTYKNGKGKYWSCKNKHTQLSFFKIMGIDVKDTMNIIRNEECTMRELLYM